MTPDRKLFALAYVNPITGRVTHYLGAHDRPASSIGAARKFSAESEAESAIGPLTHARRELMGTPIDETGWCVLGVLPWAMIRAEIDARAEWDRERSHQSTPSAT